MSAELTIRRQAIVEILGRKAPRRFSVEQLCKELRALGVLHVDTKDPQRAVMRDLEKIARINTQVRSTKGKPNGWFLVRDARELPTMTPAMALWIVHSDEQSATLPPIVREHLQPWVEYARTVLARSPFADWREMSIDLPPGPPLIPPTVAEGVTDVVLRALADRRCLEIVYSARETDPPKTHTLHPFGVVTQGPKMKVVGTFHERSAVMSLILHRVISARVLDKPVCTIPGFNLRTWVNEGRLGKPISAEKIRLELLVEDASSVQFREFRLTVDQLVSPSTEPGHVRIEAFVTDTYQLRNYLWSFGRGVKVIGPAHVRKVFADDVAALHAFYGAEERRRSEAAREGHARARAAGGRVGRRASVEVDVARVRELHHQGCSGRKIARILNVPVGAVQRAIADVN